MWVGNNVGYWGLHSRLYKEFGKQKECQHCGEKGEYKYRKNGVKFWTIQYANKSHEYKKELSLGD